MVMRTMRANLGILKWMFVLLLLVFGVGLVLPGFSSRRSLATAAAVVDGQPVSGTLYSRVITSRLERERQRAGGELTEGESLKIRRKTLEDMIDEELAIQHAKDLGLSLNDAEFRDLVLQDPSLKDKQGRFDQAKYQQILQGQIDKGMTVDEVEKNFMRGMLLSKVRSFWSSQATLNPVEQSAAEASYDRQLKVKAAVFEISKVQAGLKMEEEDLRVFYSQNKQGWVKPEQVKLRQILVRSEFGGATLTSKTKADKILASLKAGADFKAVASKENADEAARKNGGDLGWMGRSDLRHPEVADEAFGLKKGQLSKVVQSPEGFHILKLEDRKAGFEPTFAGQRAEVIKSLGRQRAGREVSKRAGLALAAIKAGKSVEEAAKAQGGSVVVSNWFGYDDTTPIPALGPSVNLVQAAFEKKVGESLEDAVEADKGAAAVVLAEEKPGPQAKAEKAVQRTQNARMAAQAQKAQVLYDAWIKGLRDKVVVQDHSGVLASK